MSFEEFIVKYYVWVLAILLILIITIIGFIADKKIKKKKEGKEEMNEQNMQNNQFMTNNNGFNPMPNVGMEPQPVEAQNINQNMGMPNMESFNQPAAPMPNAVPPVMPTPAPTMEMPNLNTAPSNDDFNYKPLSEQTPNIPPRFDGMNMIGSQPVEATPVNNNVNPMPSMDTNMQAPSFPQQPINNMVPPVMNPSENIGYNVPPMQQPVNIAPVQPVEPTPAIEPIQSINPEPIVMPNQNVAPQPISQPIVEPMPNQGMVNNPYNQNMQPVQQPTPVEQVPNNGNNFNNMFVTGNNNMPENNTNNPW